MIVNNSGDQKDDTQFLAKGADNPLYDDKRIIIHSVIIF